MRTPFNTGLHNHTSLQVIIVEDDNGEIVREMTKDTEVIAQYKTMRETIVYLTNLNYEDTEAIMLEKLDLQVGTLCGECVYNVHVIHHLYSHDRCSRHYPVIDPRVLV